MNDFWPTFLFAFGAIALAEMGDKTQLLAMAFATRYGIAKVLVGILIATFLTHALAVAVGNFFAQLETLRIIIQALASLSFIVFGIWTLRGENPQDEEKRKAAKFGVIMTVGMTFFIAEMGDKTQLVTMALATKFPRSPVGVLAGSTAGMLMADGLGILLGYVLHRKMPERTIRLIAATAFIVFGCIGLYQLFS